MRWGLWAALVICLGLQLYGLYAPTMPGPDVGVPQADKVGHVLAFGAPTALAVWLGARWLLPLLVLHAVVSEPIQQALARERLMDVWDAVANLAGVALGVFVATWLRRRVHDGSMTATEDRHG